MPRRLLSIVVLFAFLVSCSSTPARRAAGRLRHRPVGIGGGLTTKAVDAITRQEGMRSAQVQYRLPAEEFWEARFSSILRSTRYSSFDTPFTPCE